jgi:hypothetical protein
MPLFLRIQTIGLEEGDPVPFFQNVLMMVQQPEPMIHIPVFVPPTPIVDQSWLAAPLSLT